MIYYRKRIQSKIGKGKGAQSESGEARYKLQGSSPRGVTRDVFNFPTGSCEHTCEVSGKPLEAQDPEFLQEPGHLRAAFLALTQREAGVQYKACCLYSWGESLVAVRVVGTLHDLKFPDTSQGLAW